MGQTKSAQQAKRRTCSHDKTLLINGYLRRMETDGNISSLSDQICQLCFMYWYTSHPVIIIRKHKTKQLTSFAIFDTGCLISCLRHNF